MEPWEWVFSIGAPMAGVYIIYRFVDAIQFGPLRRKRFSGWVLPGSREWRRRAVDRKWQREEDRNETCRRNAQDALDNLLRTHKAELNKLRAARQTELSGWQNEFNEILWSDQARRDAENARLSALSDQTSFVYMGIHADSERVAHLPDWRDRLAHSYEWDNDQVKLMCDGAVIKTIPMSTPPSKKDLDDLGYAIYGTPGYGAYSASSDRKAIEAMWEKRRAQSLAAKKKMKDKRKRPNSHL